MTQLKILVCGSVDGNFVKIFKRISNVQKKNGPFEMVICTGDFFSTSSDCKTNWKSWIQSAPHVPVPLYILGPTNKELEKFYSKDLLVDGGELYENVLYLGRKGVFKSSSGLVITYLSGSQNYNKDEIDTLKSQVTKDDHFRGVDILITATWPKDVTKYTSAKIPITNESELVSSLASAIRPRYHLTCHKDIFFERLPYRNHEVLRGQQHVTRFIATAPFNNKNNEKAIYAFSITPMVSLTHEELVKQPIDVTEFPYKEVMLSIQQLTKQSEQFFFDQSNKRKQDRSKEERQHKIPKGPPALTDACWFCLGGKEVEKHLVISVGELCYVALAKGSLNNDHVLVCPITHHNSTVVLPQEALMEMEKYKRCLAKMFEKENKTLVAFERNFYTQHLQLQIVGVPIELEEEIKDTFLDLAGGCDLDLVEIPEEKDLMQCVSSTTPYFHVEIGLSVRLLHKVKGKMPLQFGREVLASPSLLNLPGRVDWKSCKLSKEEEIECAKRFRQRFQPFDFNFT